MQHENVDEPPRLLPGLGLPAAMEQHLRESLALLRDQATDPAVRRSIDDVLAGRLSLRQLASDDAFGQMMNPLVEEGVRRLEALSPEDEARAREGAAALERGEDPLAAMDQHSTLRSTGPDTYGTW
jgi:hypothetical protein